MWRGTPADTSWRTYSSVVRVTINKMDDDRLMQEGSADFFHSDTRERIERVQNYGFSSVPLPRDEQQGGGNSQEPAGIKGPAAEGVVIHGAGGARNLPLMIAIDDRRHRPRGLKPGENAQYDDQQQMMLLARNGAFVMSTKGMASLRHVTKQKQPAPASGVSSGGRAQQTQQQEYDHTGGTANTDIQCTKDSIFIFVDGECMAEIVRTEKKVYLGGRSSDPMSKVMTEDGPSENVYAKIAG